MDHKDYKKRDKFKFDNFFNSVNFLTSHGLPFGPGHRNSTPPKPSSGEKKYVL